MRVQLRLLSLGMALTICGAANANLLTNGNLDDTYQQEIVSGFFLPKPTTWVNVGSRAITGPYEDEMSSEQWAGPAPTPVTTDTNASFPGGAGLDAGVFFKAFSGNTANGAATGHLYQDVAATPGLLYTMTGWAGGEANFLATDAVFALDFLDAGGGLLSTNVLSLMPTLTVDNGEPFDYKLYSLSAVAPAGATTVRVRVSMIEGIPNPQGGGQAFVVDDFTLTAVPEPSTIAILGMGGLLALRKARRRAK